MGIGRDHEWVMRFRSLFAGAAVLFGVVVPHLLDGFAQVSEQDHHLEAVTQGHGSGLPPWMATLLVIGVVVFARPLPTRLKPLLVALPFISWAVQETTERAGGGESLPFSSNSLKHIALGLVVQLPVALFIYFLVRVAIVVVRKIAAPLSRETAVRADPGGSLQACRGFVPTISVMARGSPTRGPPLLVTAQSY